MNGICKIEPAVICPHSFNHSITLILRMQPFSTTFSPPYPMYFRLCSPSLVLTRSCHLNLTKSPNLCSLPCFYRTRHPTNHHPVTEREKDGEREKVSARDWPTDTQSAVEKQQSNLYIQSCINKYYNHIYIHATHQCAYDCTALFCNQPSGNSIIIAKQQHSYLVF
ncbi:hypothetical protein BDF19DRAFT_295798 [Syncephalis fuscata]|nr:hypothetical protein BDF19DRAFT_295798 [Syncephalis fuscata]